MDPVALRRDLIMAAPQLSVRSAKARDLARREHRSIADVVERALEAYEIREAGREPASVFYARLAQDYGSDLDLEIVIRETERSIRDWSFDLTAAIARINGRRSATRNLPDFETTGLQLICPWDF